MRCMPSGYHIAQSVCAYTYTDVCVFAHHVFVVCCASEPTPLINIHTGHVGDPLCPHVWYIALVVRIRVGRWSLLCSGYILAPIGSCTVHIAHSPKFQHIDNISIGFALGRHVARTQPTLFTQLSNNRPTPISLCYVIHHSPLSTFI